jgi:hypothetical protein
MLAIVEAKTLTFASSFSRPVFDARRADRIRFKR